MDCLKKTKQRKHGVIHISCEYWEYDYIRNGNGITNVSNTYLVYSFTLFFLLHTHYTTHTYVEHEIESMYNEN